LPIQYPLIAKVSQNQPKDNDILLIFRYWNLDKWQIHADLSKKLEVVLQLSHTFAGQFKASTEPSADSIFFAW